MKKIFVLALAAVMTAGMTTVAFAKDPKVTDVQFTGYVYYDQNGDEAIDEYETYNRGGVTGNDTLGNEIVAGGTELYFAVMACYDSAETPKVIDKLADVKGWDVVADWSVEDDSVEEPKFVQAKIDGKYGIYLKLVLPENDSVKNRDLVGTIGLGDTKSDAKKAAGNNLAQLSITYGRDKTNVAGNVDIKSFDGDFTGGFASKGAVVDFDNVEEEIDIDFNDLALFTVDVTGQGKLDLRFNTKYDPEFGDMYEYANIDFLTFPGEPRFNRTGTMVIYCENEDAFIYEVTEDGAKALKAEYDEDEGGFVFRTRALASYAISDVELDEKTVVVDDDNKTDGGKENPDTGR